MSILMKEGMNFIVQGITGREAVSLTRENLDYGAEIVGGVTPGRAGRDVYGVPVYDCVAHITKDRKVDGSVICVPPKFTRDAAFEAIENGIKLLVIVTERIPRREVAQMVELATMRGARIIGPNCLGLISPGEAKMGGIPKFLEGVRAGDERLIGFGHRVYKSYDPRARIIKQTADEVFDLVGRNQLLDIALELERIALEDDYFIEHKLYPNVDFYSGIIYQALGFPVGMFPVLFAIPRTSGWLAQWVEMLTDEDQRIARPRQIFEGSGTRDYQPIEKRS